jgi:hypothetical protein
VNRKYKIKNRCIKKGECIEVYCDFSYEKGMSYLIVENMYERVMKD